MMEVRKELMPSIPISWRCAIDVSGAWRLTFEFDGTDAIVVDYEQYH